ncbi:MAG: CBS domain-containing protein, partial [Gammaproteobacteria bacterium]
KNQVRRLPVLNRAKRLVGMVSLGDLAVHAPAESAGEALRGISRTGT